MTHILLLGDSIFDNIAYVNGGPDVIASLRDVVPSDWQAGLGAVDGSVIKDVTGQLLDSPADVTHYVVSVGGNDAILNSDVLQMPVNHSAEVFNELAHRVSIFEQNYLEMLAVILERNIPTIVCTIYYPNFPDEFVQKISVSALSAFNDVIIRLATENNIPYIDLRLVCNEKDDYANEIEPSSKGGRKIAAKITKAVMAHDFVSGKTCVYF